MAVHSLPEFSDSSEAIYQSYLTLVGKTDEEVMGDLKRQLVERVISTVNEKGANKFKKLSIAEKINFIQTGE